MRSSTHFIVTLLVLALLGYSVGFAQPSQANSPPDIGDPVECNPDIMSGASGAAALWNAHLGVPAHWDSQFLFDGDTNEIGFASADNGILVASNTILLRESLPLEGVLFEEANGLGIHNAYFTGFLISPNGVGHVTGLSVGLPTCSEPWDEIVVPLSFSWDISQTLGSNDAAFQSLSGLSDECDGEPPSGLNRCYESCAILRRAAVQRAKDQFDDESRRCGQRYAAELLICTAVACANPAAGALCFAAAIADAISCRNAALDNYFDAVRFANAQFQACVAACD